VPGYDQELDVLAPGSWVRGPFPGYPGYNHLPWWAPGRGWIVAPPNLVNFYYVGGTSMATPHVTGVIALMLQKSPNLTQEDVEYILESTALDLGLNSAFSAYFSVATAPSAMLGCFAAFQQTS
jgi:subtilisin family serine protease